MLRLVFKIWTRTKKKSSIRTAKRFWILPPSTPKNKWEGRRKKNIRNESNEEKKENIFVIIFFLFLIRLQKKKFCLFYVYEWKLFRLNWTSFFSFFCFELWTLNRWLCDDLVWSDNSEVDFFDDNFFKGFFPFEFVLKNWWLILKTIYYLKISSKPRI